MSQITTSCIAQVLREAKQQSWRVTVFMMLHEIERQYPGFDRRSFLQQCGLYLTQGEQDNGTSL